jgi:hypothetical protein
MRGTLTFKDQSFRTVHISTGETSPHVTFSLYDLLSDSFEPVLILLDYRLFFPDDGALLFSGYRIPEDFDGLENRPQVGESFEFVEAEFLPAGFVMVDDIWARKCAGQFDEKGTSFKE